MSDSALDREWTHLFARALAEPFFDVERALCRIMKTHVQTLSETMHTLAYISGDEIVHPASFVKFFSWPGGDMCAAVCKAQTDSLIYVDVHHGLCEPIDSIEPALKSVCVGDRFVIFNPQTSRYLPEMNRERVLLSHLEEPNQILERELQLQAFVLSRGNSALHPSHFIARALTV